MNTTPNKLLNSTRLYIAIIITGLAISGITAFPLETELAFLTNHSAMLPGYMHTWLNTIYLAIKDTNMRYPYLSYGTDWLAFAHIVLAILFIGPLRHPLKNIWVIEFGMIACVLIFPLAFIAGEIRQIPYFWRLIDCSFGAIGIVPLYLAYLNLKKLSVLSASKNSIG